MDQDKMALISVFSKFMLLFITAQIASALNSPVPVVQTVSNVTLISGKEGTLTCKYNRTVFAVYWRYESTTSPIELLLALDKFYEEGKISGPGYDEGRFNITDDYSLIIHDVQATDEGKYICEVADFEKGQVFWNHTDVTTVVIAERPFIRIGQCEEEVSADEISESSCSLHTATDDLSIQLSCTVVGAKPIVDLIWEASMPSQYWKQVMDESTLTTRERGNGIFDQSLTVNVDVSHIKSSKQHITCVGKGLAVEGVANYTIAVYPAQVIAERPFIRIGQCEDEASADEINEPCVLHTTSDDRTVQLTCSVFGAKPLVDLIWESSVSSERWKQLMNQSTLRILERENEIFDQTLTVNIDTTHIKSNKQRFTCIGQGLAVDGMANYTIAVYPARGSYGTRTVVISIVCILFFIFVIIGVLWTWWRVRDKRRSQNGEDPENQEANTPLTQIDGDAVESRRESDATSVQIDGDALGSKGELDATPAHSDGYALEGKGKLDASPAQIDGDAPESKGESDAPQARIKRDAPESKGESDALLAQIDGDAPKGKGESDSPPAEINGDALESKEETDAPQAHSDGDALESKEESDAHPENKAAKPNKRALLEEKRTKIRKYQPNKPTTTNEDTTYINIGVFGLVNAGKLSFINSLIFALTGNYPTADAGTTAADNQKYGSFNTDSNKLTDHIYFIKFKGMVNYKLNEVSRFYRLREIRPGKGARNTPKSQIYCPIFILDYSTYTKRCRKFMKGFSDDVRSYFGMGITVVVTKKNTFGGDDAINMMHQNLIKEQLSKATGVTEKRIWIFENYTGDNQEEDVERSIEFLDFILQCLDVVKANQTFRKNNREKRPLKNKEG